MQRPDRNSQRSRAAAIAAGMRWATTISAVSLEMALPPVLGLWIDKKLGTSPVFLAGLAVLGMVAAMMHLRQLVLQKSASEPSTNRSTGKRSSPDDSNRGKSP